MSLLILISIFVDDPFNYETLSGRFLLFVVWHLDILSNITITLFFWWYFWYFTSSWQQEIGAEAQLIDFLEYCTRQMET